MVFQLVCSTCGRDISEERYALLIKEVNIKKVLSRVKNSCCRLKLSTQIEPQRNLTVQPLLDIN
ncbi:RNA polymerase subunit [Lumpy skin disease virus]|uniref:DNA-directed RNA polymerase 7 kDa subunit n=5 Tax=Capripoxvirus TaxID=10265 RepID=A0A3F2YKK8_SHEVT|nr:RNA polymerase [Lumpy skin disease virus NI-2490]NP_659627.1 RNA polymerase [Sheeppox virus]YP_001293246.1 RNA polymerase [Goatpox virus Pellor]AAN02623.1 RNA polymerase subunit [Lumpy skin disease virus NW-LW]AAN02780.1 RNA polymerase subunit [Lumpy skin disease virus]AGZ95370.1 RNA polymerase subunit PRO7 [Goatpox virus FZ]AOA33013.1 RNA polymerase [Goatpox virus]AAK85016.1 LSDV055 RNA polymerase subunit [Lumpy skin disease virus NI-2490]